MIRFKPVAFGLFVLAQLMSVAPSAHAAESYDNCTGFITSLPAVITTQGTWCLRQDLSTAVATGNAIEIQTDNVIVDCNDFKISGLAAGFGTGARGIYALDRHNLTVRHCSIRGFAVGIDLTDSGNGTAISHGGGHLVEDNRLDNNTVLGITVDGDGSVIRRNRIFDSGGSTIRLENYAYGISAGLSTDVLENTVSGVLPRIGGNGNAVGIQTFADKGTSVNGNRVRGLIPDGTGHAIGIENLVSGRLVFRNNDLIGDGRAGSIGIACDDATGRARNNVINKFATGLTSCSDDGGNVTSP